MPREVQTVIEIWIVFSLGVITWILYKRIDKLEKEVKELKRRPIGLIDSVSVGPRGMEAKGHFFRDLEDAVKPRPKGIKFQNKSKDWKNGKQV